MAAKLASKPAKATKGGPKRIPSAKRLGSVRTLYKGITPN
jgi:hypothetical protein